MYIHIGNRQYIQAHMSVHSLKEKVPFFIAKYTNELSQCMYVSGAIYGFARSADRAAQFADRAAQFADPHITKLICRSRNHR